jgi:hypothetical protein
MLKPPKVRKIPSLLFKKSIWVANKSVSLVNPNLLLTNMVVFSNPCLLLKNSVLLLSSEPIGVVQSPRLELTNPIILGFETFAVLWRLYSIFWTILRRKNFMSGLCGTLCLIHLHGQYEWPMKMDHTVCSESSAYKIQRPVNYPKEGIQGPARLRPTALLPPRSNGKTRGCCCCCSCWAPDDGREDSRNMLSCT